MKLTNLQKYAIQGMVADNKTASQIAKAIGKPEATILRYIETIVESIIQVEEIKASSQPAVEPTPEEIAHEAALDTSKFTQENVKEVAIAGRKKSGDYMINKSSSGDAKGIKIMTGAASALAEAKAANYDTPTFRNAGAIFKPKG